ncbi:MAG: class I SAM-dependent methyltransferase [Halofilum sp. (in: g-proteobacteria)]
MANTTNANWAAHDYADGRFKNLDQRIVHALESRAAFRYLDQLVGPGGSVLDMPAGCGRFTEPLLQRGLAVTAVDPKQDRLDYLASTASGKVELHCLFGENLPFADDEFDASFCIRLFQHIRDREQRVAILAQLGRVSRRGVVATVYMDSRMHRLIHGMRRLKRLARYNRASLEEEFAAGGLQIQSISRPIPGHAQTVVQAIPL